MQEINNTNLKEILEEILHKNLDKNEDFKNGMSAVVQGLNDYINAPPPPKKLSPLSADFKNFGLEQFLNHDESKFPAFEKLIQLFKIQMGKVNRRSTWNVYPEELDSVVANTLIQCFDGIHITHYSTDFDRDAIEVDLRINVIKENGSKARLDISSYGYIEDYGFSDKQDGDNDYKISEKLNIYLGQEEHYETLFLYVCLKKFYQYINAENIDKLLEIERKN